MIFKYALKESVDTKKKVLLLVLSVVILLIGILSYLVLIKDTTPSSEHKSDKDLTFFVASDIHYLSDKLTDHGVAYEKFVTTGDGKVLKYIDSIMDAFVYDIKKEKPDILIVSGDLTTNGEKASHLDLAEKFKTIEENGTQVLVVSGNHDIYNPFARSFQGDKQYFADYISDKDFSEIYGPYGYDNALSRDENSLSYLAAPSDKLWLLMLDSNKYMDNITVGVPSADGLLKKGTQDWIKNCLNAAKEKEANVVVVMHHNILNHSEVIREGYTLNNSGQALILLKDYPVNLVLSGHIHVQDISSDLKSPDPLYDIASGALSVYPHLYGVINYSAANNTLNYHTQSVEVNSWAKIKHIKDKNLLNFNTYSKDYFGKVSYNRTYKSLIDSGYADKQAQLMADTIRTLNLRYFSGTENLNATEVKNSEGYKLWLDSPDSFRKFYIESIVTDNNTDDNRLTIQLPQINKAPSN